MTIIRSGQKDFNALLAQNTVGGIREAPGENVGTTDRKRAEAKLLTLHDHAQQLASAKTLDAVIEHTLDAMQFTLEFRSAEFWLVDETRGRILRRGARGIASPITEFRLDGPGVTVKAVNTGLTIKVADSRKEPEYVDEEGRVGEKKSPVKLSELAVPVFIGDKVIALLDAESISLDYFTDEDQRLLETLASHVSSAMLRLRHEDELQLYAKHLEELVEERTGRLQESEMELRSTKDRLEYVIESNPAAIYIGKPLPDFSDYYPTYISKSTTSLTGFESRKFIGEKAMQFWASKVHPDDLRSYLAEIDRLWKDGHGAYEYRFMHQDGNYRWIREEARVVRDPNGRPVEVIGYWTDITDRKRTEEATSRLAAIVESTSDAIYAHDLKGVITSWNNGATKIYGYSAQEVIGKSINILIPRDRQDDLRNILQSIGNEEVVKNYETERIRKDGKALFVSLTVSSIKDSSGRLVGASAIARDITERKRAEDALRTSEAEVKKLNNELAFGLLEVTDRIESIGKLREKLRHSPDLSTELKTVLDSVLWDFGMEIGTVLAFDKEKGLATLQAIQARSESSQPFPQTYMLNGHYVEFEANPTENVSKVIAEGDNSILHTASVHSIAITAAQGELYGVLALGSNKAEPLTKSDQSILKLYAELISQTVTERRLTITPVREENGTMTQKNELQFGSIYLTNDNQSLAYETFLETVRSGSEGLCITREHPAKTRERLGLEKTPIVWLTGEATPTEKTVQSLQDISIMIGDFLEKAQRPVVLLDGVEYLIANSGFASFLKFLQIIRDRLQLHEAILLAPITEGALEPRWFKLIEREAEPLPVLTGNRQPGSDSDKAFKPKIRSAREENPSEDFEPGGKLMQSD